VLPSSPASTAGLLPYGDYITGTPSGIVRGEAGLGELVEDHLSRPLRLFVYNHEYDLTRLVTITPSRGWGGSGALGCVLGFGALHRLPAPLTEPPHAPGETLFETAPFSNEEARPPSNPAFVPATTASPLSQQSGTDDFLIPAQMTSPPPLAQLTTTSPPPQTGHSRPVRKTRHAISPNKAFDEYFKEGEQKSKEEDFAPTTAKPRSLPPPPKAGVLPPKSSASPVPAQEDGEVT